MATVIVLDSGGRMGNKLINFATVYAWCLHRGHRLFNPAFYAYAPLFPNLDQDLFLSGTHPMRLKIPMRRRLQKLALRLGRTASERGWVRGRVYADTPAACVFLPPSETTFDDTTSSRFYLQGWYYRNPVGLDMYRDKIVKLLEPQLAVRQSADAFVALMGAESVNIAVHIRQGDYKTERADLYLDVPKYAEQMIRVRDEIKRLSGRPTKFAIFSDEQRDANEFSPWGLETVVSRGKAIDDLTRMSRFAGIIAAPSTFSQWAAYVGGGVVLELGQHPDSHMKYIQTEPLVQSLDAFIDVLRRRGALARV